MLKISKDLFDRWNNNSVVYCHWKSNEHLAEGLEGETDLDVLLSPKDKELGCSILRDLRFVKFHSQFGSRYPNVEDWIGFDYGTGRLVHLHLHFALMTGHKGVKEYELPWIGEALSTRTQDQDTGVFIMNPTLELVSLYTRLILKANRNVVRVARAGRYRMGSHFQKEIAFVRQRADENMLGEISRRYFGKDWSEFLHIVKQPELSAALYVRLNRIVSSAMAGCSRFHGVPLRLRRAFYPVAVKLKRRLDRWGWVVVTRKVANPQGGFSVAFIGQDGSGKSTVTEAIRKWLNWKIEANRFYLGSGEHYNSLLKRIISRGVSVKHRHDGVSASPGVNPDLQKKRKKGIRSFISTVLVSWNMLRIARRAYRVLRAAEKYKRRGGIPLYDRFPQMQFEGIYDGPRIANYYKKTGLDFYLVRLMARREYSLFKKIQQWQPDLVFKLILPPEESIRRKPFENLDNVIQKHRVTQELVFPDSRVFTVDAMQDYNNELLFIKRQIWESVSLSTES